MIRPLLRRLAGKVFFPDLSVAAEVYCVVAHGKQAEGGLVGGAGRLHTVHTGICTSTKVAVVLFDFRTR